MDLRCDSSADEDGAAPAGTQPQACPPPPPPPPPLPLPLPQALPSPGAKVTPPAALPPQRAASSVLAPDPPATLSPQLDSVPEGALRRRLAHGSERRSKSPARRRRTPAPRPAAAEPKKARPARSGWSQALRALLVICGAAVAALVYSPTAQGTLVYMHWLNWPPLSDAAVADPTLPYQPWWLAWVDGLAAALEPVAPEWAPNLLLFPGVPSARALRIPVDRPRLPRAGAGAGVGAGAGAGPTGEALSGLWIPGDSVTDPGLLASPVTTVLYFHGR